MLSTLLTLAAESEAHRELPMSPWAFGGIALALFALGLLALWSFRGTAHKVAHPRSVDDVQDGHDAWSPHGVHTAETTTGGETVTDTRAHH